MKVSNHKSQNIAQSKAIIALCYVIGIFRNMFFCFGICFFDARLKEYGGFNHFIADKIFKWKYCYLAISIRKQFKFNHIFESEEYYYDGYHNVLNIGFIQISYGT